MYILIIVSAFSYYIITLQPRVSLANCWPVEAWNSHFWSALYFLSTRICVMSLK
jgi:hypothetical protein